MAVMTALAIGAGVSAIGGAVAANQADKAAGRAQRNKTNAQRELDAAKASRATIINPYASTKDLSSMAKDLSGQISNPYANLGVATQAAEIQMEQADIALANTLDTLRATGASAGGATALAQAALQSKKGISASIEAQEAQNEKLRAQGELQQQQMKMSEAQRLQQADVSGKQFEFTAREARETAQLDRLSAQISGAEARQAQAQADKTRAITGAVGGVVSTFGSMAAAGAFSNPSGSSYDTSKFGVNQSKGFDFKV